MALMASAGTSIFPVTLPSPHSGAKGSEFRGGRKSLGGLKSKHVSFGCLQVKASAQAPSKVNGTVVTTTVQEGFVSRQKFSIKSYEIDADRKMSMLTLMNYLQAISVSLLIRP
ncbi:hypothetical protein RIF29_09322 [Crotalaria pallida]|uniref:Acyl-ACP-thioesterase N-terminal domain-containing protein n=1 Tax=Crotalaria pallida TaxID=3830 RepID=A0AAN9IJE1_CROPI